METALQGLGSRNSDIPEEDEGFWFRRIIYLVSYICCSITCHIVYMYIIVYYSADQEQTSSSVDGAPSSNLSRGGGGSCSKDLEAQQWDHTLLNLIKDREGARELFISSASSTEYVSKLQLKQQRL